MNCAVCDTEGAHYNRAIVRSAAEESVGGLCSDCESELFGDTFEDPVWCQGESCVFCEDEGRIALPMHHMELIEVGEDEVIFEDHPVVDETPRLCPDHATLYVGVEPVPRPEPVEIEPEAISQ